MLFALIRDKQSRIPLELFGPPGDGGYLMPNELSGLTALISPGVSTECGFDLAMAERGLPVIMADASVDGPPIAHLKFEFHKKFLDTYDSQTTVRLETLVAQSPSTADGGEMLLQMDIESAEYRVLVDTPTELMKRFRIMVIEFHRFDDIFGRSGFDLICTTLRRLTAHHRIVHIHPNNCHDIVSCNGFDVPPVLEMTFLHQSFCDIGRPGSIVAPHPLDRDNVSSRPSIQLPKCWLEDV